MESQTGEGKPKVSWVRALAKEPLVHFARLGGAIFMIGNPGDPPSAGASQELVVSQAFVEELRAAHLDRSGEPASEERLLDQFRREEALVRHARSIGLDSGDAIIRRRLQQKMEFVLEGQVELEEPSAEQLDEFVARTPEQFLSEPRVSFQLRMFGSERSDPRGDAESFAVRSTGPEDVGGDPFVLGSQLSGRARSTLVRELGESAASAIFEAEREVWIAPIDCPFGALAIFVTERTDGGTTADELARQRALGAYLQQEGQCHRAGPPLA